MRVLIGCEFSGKVRDAFIRNGHDAVSCDLLDTESPGPHLRCDIFEALAAARWDMLIAFPPCTHLASSGARWFYRKAAEQAAAIKFATDLWECGIGKVAIENPVGVLSSRMCKPTQIIQPWMFGHGETKATCLWLKGLPKLQPARVVSGREHRIHRMPPSKDRWRERSRTFAGIADAMATQWG